MESSYYAEKRHDVIEMYAELRKHNQTIPDHSLEFMKHTCLAKIDELEQDEKEANMVQSEYIKTIKYPCILESDNNIVAFVEESAGVLVHSKDDSIKRNTYLVGWDMYQFRKIPKG